MPLSTKAWVGHLAAPFDAPLAIARSHHDDVVFQARAWGSPLAASGLRCAGDAAASLAVRMALTVPVATYAVARWAYHRHHHPCGWLIAAPVCGMLGGLGLGAMGVSLDAVRLALMLGLAAMMYVYALGQGAVWLLGGFGRGRRAPTVFFSGGHGPAGAMQAPGARL